MITRDNIKEFIQTIPTETIQEELDKPQDFILLQSHIFNVGGYATIESLDYDEEVDEDAPDTLDQVPLIQLMQVLTEVAAGVDDQNPLAHLMHWVAVQAPVMLEYEPARHGWHPEDDVRPVAEDHVPAAQLMQVVPSEVYVPTPHVTAECTESKISRASVKRKIMEPTLPVTA